MTHLASLGGMGSSCFTFRNLLMFLRYVSCDAFFTLSFFDRSLSSNAFYFSNMDLTEENFKRNFEGSATANLLFAVGYVLFLGIRKLCTRDSHCHSKFHSCCLDVDIEDNTPSPSPRVQIKVTEA